MGHLKEKETIFDVAVLTLLTFWTLWEGIKLALL